MADSAVVGALAAKNSPAIQERDAAAKAEGKAEGLAEGKAQAILQVLEARGIRVSEAQRQEVLRCHDLDFLDRWLLRAALASSAGELTAEF
jgi:predicted transposase YdaD